MNVLLRFKSFTSGCFLTSKINFVVLPRVDAPVRQSHKTLAVQNVFLAANEYFIDFYYTFNKSDPFFIQPLMFLIVIDVHYF